ncbi:sensor domain-containing diguanylate cyclase [Paenibacillus sp. HGH0039]|uniref:sensor domain-containing diguanylate cyclase n=1 Tax=Paenibacillus sp. HGH0039 TaxID=1078505 RepID=UPI0011DE5593|nr:GGDEF domain-containing protein [Paenibacillus sp. HGH0039]
MSTLRELIFPSKQTGDSLLFTQSHHGHLFHRIKLVSILLIAVYPYYFYADFFLYLDVPDEAYRYGSIGIHLLSTLISVLFLILYRLLRNQTAASRTIWPPLLVTAYTALYLFIGMLSSINSQSLTGNVDAYIIILLSAAIILPIHPKNFLVILLINHPVFLVLLSMANKDKFDLLTKQINTTGTAVIACFIVLTLYNLRKKDFINTRKLRENEIHFRKLFAVNPYPLVLSRIRDNTVVQLNAEAAHFFQIPLDSGTPADASITYPSSADKDEILHELLQKDSIKNRICQLSVSPHSQKWVMINYELIIYDNETCVLAGITDITELKKAEAELARYASLDALTGVLNRGHGMALLQQELVQCREQGGELVVCFVDINNLKEVNDRYGHAEGDSLINKACEVLQRNLEPEDYLFRYGGDEFVLVFHTRPDAADLIWSRIREDLLILSREPDSPFPVSVSHGFFAVGPGTDMSAAEVIEAADKEMYIEKHSYKNNTCSPPDPI